MIDKGVVKLEFVSDSKEFPEAAPADDRYLVFFGQEYGNRPSKLASIGRIVTKPMPDGTLAFVLFQFHRPSKLAREVIDAVGSPELQAPPVICFLKGRFYIMEKPLALEYAGALDSSV